MSEDRSPSRCWRSGVAVLVAAAIGACGDDGPTQGQGDAAGQALSAPRAATPATSDTTAKSDTAAPQDGRLTTPTGKVITDHGDPGQRLAAVRALDRLQQDFRASRMTAACSRINDFMLSQFTPADTQDETPCPDKLEAYANARVQQGEPTKHLRLLGVREYTRQAGVWVEEPDGNRLRIQLSQPFGGGDGWQLDLGSLGRPDVLDAELIGADRYGKR